MTILVTGATGLVGNNVVRALLERGEPVRVLLRPRRDRVSLRGLDVQFAEGDVRDRQAVAAACQGVRAVVHAAAVVHIGWSKLALQREVNVEGTRHVCREAQRVDARLVHVSSVDALGAGALDAPADEQSPLLAKVPCGYVVTKRDAESAVMEAVEQGLDAVIVNPGFMLGPWDWTPSSGRMLIAVATRFTPIAPPGGCSVCDVRDVAAGICTAIEHGQTGRRYILAGANLTYLEAWRLFAQVASAGRPVMRAGPLMRVIAGWTGDLKARLTGVEPDLNSASVAMSRMYHYYDSSRAGRELGYHSRPTETTVRDAWDWFREHEYL